MGPSFIGPHELFDKVARSVEFYGSAQTSDRLEGADFSAAFHRLVIELALPSPPPASSSHHVVLEKCKSMPFDPPAARVHLESSPERKMLRSAAFTPLPRRQPADQSFRSLPFGR